MVYMKELRIAMGDTSHYFLAVKIAQLLQVQSVISLSDKSILPVRPVVPVTANDEIARLPSEQFRRTFLYSR